MRSLITRSLGLIGVRLESFGFDLEASEIVRF